MPSGTSCNTISGRRRMSSKSAPTIVRGESDGPKPGLSNQCLLDTLSGSAGRTATSSHQRLSPRSGLSDTLCISTSCPRGAHICTYKQTPYSISIYIIYIRHAISTNTKHTYQHHQNQTYLGGQKPPLEVAPCPDHLRSQP
jgi:hypothetical protein